jgi:hypothetical protein
MNIEKEHEFESEEAREAYENAETLPNEGEMSPEAIALEQEKLIEAMEANPELEASVEEEIAEAAEGKVLSQEEFEALADSAEGLATAAELLKEGGDLNYTEMLEQLLENRYNLTIQDLLSGLEQTNFERLFNYPVGSGAMQDVVVYGLAKSFGVELKDMDLQEKAEVRFKVGADLLKVFGLIAKFIPQARAAAIPLDVAGGMMGRTASAMEEIRTNPESTSYDAAKAMTLAVLPRDKDGKIDKVATAALIAEVGGMMKAEDSQDSTLKAMYTLFGEQLAENPKEVMDALEKMDAIVKAT